MATVFRQQLTELVAQRLGGVSSRQLADWRRGGAVPHPHRLRLAELAEGQGIKLYLHDFEDWRTQRETRAAP